MKTPDLLAKKKFILLLMIVTVFTIAITLWYFNKPEDILYKGLKPVNIVTGPPDNQLDKPIAVAVGPRGQLYIVDSGNKRVLVMEEDGRYSMSFGGPGSGLAELSKPVGIDVSPKGNVYVADEGKKGVLVFSTEGEYIRTIAGEKTENFTPSTIKTDNQGNLYIFNSAAKQFDVFDANSKRLKVLSSKAYKGIDKVTGLDLDMNKDKFYAISFGKSRYYLIDGDETQVLGENRVTNPGGIVFNRSKQLVIISDSYHNKLAVFDASGNYLGETGSLGDAMGQLRNPAGLALDETGKLYVADKGNDRVVIYNY